MEPLKLYPRGSPYLNEIWVLALLIPGPAWDAAIYQGNAIFYGCVITFLVICLLAAVFISKRYIRPVVSAMKFIKSDILTGLPKTQIVEIDDLLEYLAALDEERKTLDKEREILTAELTQAKLKAMEQNTEQESAASGVQTGNAYEQFLLNLNSLTATEQTVFNLYMKNYTAQQIANELFVTINTVKFHNRNIYAKLGVSSLKELMVYVNLMKEMSN